MSRVDRTLTPVSEPNAVRIEPWEAGDLPLLEQLLGDSAMTEHLGGPESHEQLVERQRRYEQIGDLGTGRMFKIVDEASGLAVGSVGYLGSRVGRRDGLRDGLVRHPGVPGPRYRRGGNGTGHRRCKGGANAPLHVRVSVRRQPAVERDLSQLGFTLLETREFEYPPGNVMRCNVWRLDADAPARSRPRSAPSASSPACSSSRWWRAGSGPCGGSVVAGSAVVVAAVLLLVVPHLSVGTVPGSGRGGRGRAVAGLGGRRRHTVFIVPGDARADAVLAGLRQRVGFSVVWTPSVVLRSPGPTAAGILAAVRERVDVIAAWALPASPAADVTAPPATPVEAGGLRVEVRHSPSGEPSRRGRCHSRPPRRGSGCRCLRLGSAPCTSISCACRFRHHASSRRHGHPQSARPTPSTTRAPTTEFDAFLGKAEQLVADVLDSHVGRDFLDSVKTRGQTEGERRGGLQRPPRLPCGERRGAT